MVPAWLDNSSIVRTLDNMAEKGSELRNDVFAWESCKDAWEKSEQAEQTVQWVKAKISFTLIHVFGAQSITQFAKEVGVTPASVSQYLKAYSAFPTEDKRANELTFSHHVLAAYTNEPENWINEAVTENWSTSKLREAINKTKALPVPDYQQRPPETVEQPVIEPEPVVRENEYDEAIRDIIMNKDTALQLADSVFFLAKTYGIFNEIVLIMDGYKS